jgi:hypothetical protein
LLQINVGAAPLRLTFRKLAKAIIDFASQHDGRQDGRREGRSERALASVDTMPRPTY